MGPFSQISQDLKEIYTELTQGGDASLELKDINDPFEEGIIYQVRPLNKTWKEMPKLSGGEKTLSSLALIFAIHRFKPSPLYCMDEIDAALDNENVAIVGKYIQKKAKNCQFLIISLRADMFELAPTLHGVYKIQEVTNTSTVEERDLDVDGDQIMD